MSGEPVCFDQYELEVENFQLRRSGRPVRLERIPMELLIILARQAGRLVTREEILTAIWGKGTFLDADNAINTAIRKLRRALRDNPEHPRYIETIAGKGYRFTAVLGTAKAVRSDAGNRAPGEIADTRVMLAVLPLENLSGEPEEDYFSDGLTEEIITQLGGVNPGHLGVIARTSVMRYKHGHANIREIGKKLGVDYVLEGSVRRSSGRLRVTAQLIRANDQTHLWAQSYDRLLTDILDLQDELAREVATQIRGRLPSAHLSGSTASRVMNPQAYEAYLKGRHLWNKKTEEACLKSLGHYEEAIRLLPTYAMAYAGLADSYVFLGIHGYRPAHEVYPKAESAATQAIELDDTLAEAHTACADIRKGYHWNWPSAAAEYHRAIELNPSYSVAHQWYADYLFKVGLLGEAIREIERARDLDPLSPSISAFVAFTYYRARQFDEAVKRGLEAIELGPNLPLGHWFLGLAYEGTHEFGKATAELESAVELSRRRPIYLSALGHACALAGDRSRALGIAEELKILSSRRYVSPLDIAIAYAGLAEADSAFEWLEKSYEERVMRLQELPQPTFDSLRQDPRFENLMRRLGLPM